MHIFKKVNCSHASGGERPHQTFKCVPVASAQFQPTETRALFMKRRDKTHYLALVSAVGLDAMFIFLEEEY